MKTPSEIATERQQHERALAALDDAEQAWSELSREQRLAELLHKKECRVTHNGYSDSCKFHEGKWTAMNMHKLAYHGRITRMIELVPDADDELVLKLIATAQK